MMISVISQSLLTEYHVVYIIIMSRKARIDVSGALHDIIFRGIELGEIIKSYIDQDNFLNHLGSLFSETKTSCFAWALISNHF